MRIRIINTTQIKDSIFVILCCAFGFTGFSQNLVINGSLEQWDTSMHLPGIYNAWKVWPVRNPYSVGLMRNVYHCRDGRWDHTMNYSSMPMLGVPLNFWGSQEARTGVCYGVIGIGHEGQLPLTTWMVAKLSQPLTHGTAYKVRFFVSRPDWRSWVTNGIHGYFSQDSLRIENFAQDTIIPSIYCPGVIVDSLTWTAIEGIYIAKGGERFFAVGNMLLDINRKGMIQYYLTDTIFKPFDPIGSPLSYDAQYYIEDLAIWEISAEAHPAKSGSNRAICLGESTRIGHQRMDEYQYAWSLSPFFTDTISTESSLDVSPVQTTIYYLKQIDFKFDVTYDSVVVEVVQCPGVRIPNVFTPNGDGYNDYLVVEPESPFATYRIRIFDRWGNLVFEGDQDKLWDGKYKNNELSSGVYYFTLKLHPYGDGLLTRESSGTITLLR